MIATAFSVVVQKKLGYSRWRALHALNYVAFMLVAAHILISGSDVWRSYMWMSVMAAFVVARAPLPHDDAAGAAMRTA
jgi:sulfoxide reductase heme-binding subunit YedZ